jgi:hypothetical protein
MKKIIFFSLFAVSLFLISCEDEDGLTTEPVSLDKELSYGDEPEPLEKSGGYAEFEITLENLTPATGPGASQPFSPPVITTHFFGYHIFQKYRYATSELGQLAEDAVNGPLIDMLNNSPLAYSVVEGSSGPIFPGTAQTFTIQTRLPFIKLSLACMLVNTNDAFTGADGVFLPFRGTRVYYLKAYDAGTEQNTELEANIPGPCCGSPLVRVPTNERIKHHPGIMGHGDLDPAVYGWSKHVAKLTIKRIK